jgi:murein DD-endopeptidase MepM/ murein hydrolase activator NlpD
MKDKFSVIIVPHDIKNTRTYRIPYRLFYFFLGILGVGVVSVAIFIATYGGLLVKTRELVMLEKQVSELRERNDKLSKVVFNINKIQNLEKQMRGMLGLGDSVSASESIEEGGARGAAGESIADEKNVVLRSIPSFWPVRGFITKKFNLSVSEEDPDFHRGIDIAVQRGEPVRAAATGYIVEAGWEQIFGYFVRIDHGNGIKTLYGHNERIVVKKGEKVTRGQTIAYSGNSGRSSAPHLHFEVVKNNVNVDPLEYLLQ